MTKRQRRKFLLVRDRARSLCRPGSERELGEAIFEAWKLGFAEGCDSASDILRESVEVRRPRKRSVSNGRSGQAVAVLDGLG